MTATILQLIEQAKNEVAAHNIQPARLLISQSLFNRLLEELSHIPDVLYVAGKPVQLVTGVTEVLGLWVDVDDELEPNTFIVDGKVKGRSVAEDNQGILV